MSEQPLTHAQDDRPELEDLAHKTLVELHGQSQDRKYVGYFKSQSLKKMIEKLGDPQMLQEVRGRRRADQQKFDLFGGEEGLPYLDAERVERDNWCVRFDHAKHREFDWEELETRLTENRSVWDIAVNKAVVRLDDDELHEHWVDFIAEAASRHPDIDQLYTGWISKPFFAVMESEYPGTDHIAKNVEEYHEDEPYYFLPPTTGDETHSGMGWKPRTLDLKAIWSYRAFIDKKDVIATRDIGEDDTEKLTPRKMEDALVNFYYNDQPRIGAINSPLMINKWRRAFSRGATDQKSFHWTEKDEWVQGENL
jgi:hypothetical protein